MSTVEISPYKYPTSFTYLAGDATLISSSGVTGSFSNLIMENGLYQVKTYVHVLISPPPDYIVVTPIGLVTISTTPSSGLDGQGATMFLPQYDFSGHIEKIGLAYLTAGTVIDVYFQPDLAVTGVELQVACTMDIIKLA